MAPFSRNAGSASALMGGIQMAIGASTSALVSYLNNHTSIPMTGTMAACSAMSLSVFLAGKKIIEYKTSIQQVEEQGKEFLGTT